MYREQSEIVRDATATNLRSCAEKLLTGIKSKKNMKCMGDVAGESRYVGEAV